jgi:hypothetical protein
VCCLSRGTYPSYIPLLCFPFWRAAKLLEDVFLSLPRVALSLLRVTQKGVGMLMVFSGLLSSASVAPGLGVLAPFSGMQQPSMERSAMEPDVPLGARSSWAEGDHCSTEQLNVTFMLRHSEAQLTTMHNTLMKVSDPASAAYGQHLTQAEVAKMVGRPEAVDAVRQFLVAGGVAPSSIHPNVFQDAIKVESVPCLLMEQLLSTNLRRYHSEQHGTVLRASTGYSLPASVAAHVALVAPLVRLPQRRQRPLSRPGLPAAYEPGKTAQTVSSLAAPISKEFLGTNWPADCGATCQNSHLVTPEVLAKQYGFGSAPTSGALGSMAVASFQGEYWDQDGLDYYAKWPPWRSSPRIHAALPSSALLRSSSSPRPPTSCVRFPNGCRSFDSRCQQDVRPAFIHSREERW